MYLSFFRLIGPSSSFHYIDLNLYTSCTESDQYELFMSPRVCNPPSAVSSEFWRSKRTKRSWLCFAFDYRYQFNFCRFLLTKVPFFEETELPFVRLLCTKVRPAHFYANEYIVRKGDIGQEMFIIRKGLVRIFFLFFFLTAISLYK